MALIGSYNLGNQSKLFPLYDDYLDYRPNSGKSFWEELIDNPPRRGKPAEITLVKQGPIKVQLICKNHITTEAFDTSIFGDPIQEKYCHYCVVSLKGWEGEEFIIPVPTE